MLGLNKPADEPGAPWPRITVGLFASFVIGIVIAFAGGRPAMISGAAGSVALVAAALVHAHGLQYLLVATMLAGALQIAFGLAKLDVLMRFVSKSVRSAPVVGSLATLYSITRAGR